MTAARTIRIFDTTLRDGEQSPGASMNLTEKLEIAQALVQLGVDIIEAGFPIASPGDFASVSDIARAVSAVTVCGLARCNDADIDRAWEALRHAARPRIHVFLATSSIHREFKLRMNEDEVLARAVAGVRRARNCCGDVEFSPEDAARTEIDFLCRVVEAVIDAGATTVNIPDTVGYATPSQMHHVISSLRQRVPNIDRAVISVHCHDDLGLAVANSLAAVEAGAGQVECTINGIGERAGNCSLEEVVMALKTRRDHYAVDTGVVTQRLVPTSRLVANITGIQVPRNKAIVGRNAFACSRSRGPTRSCGPRTWGWSGPTSCWASTAVAPPWQTAPWLSATNSRTSSCRRCSSGSSSWPTVRRRSTTATLRPCASSSSPRYPSSSRLRATRSRPSAVRPPRWNCGCCRTASRGACR
jgi:2-isopropylmalate synthase